MFFFFVLIFSFSSEGTSMPRLVPAAVVYRQFSLCCVRASALLLLLCRRVMKQSLRAGMFTLV